MTSIKNIRDAIIGRIETGWATTTPIHWPATKFKIDPTAAYIQPRVIFRHAAQISLGQNGHNRIFGDLHTNVFVPIGAGDDEAASYCDLLRDLFPRGLSLLAGSRSIMFETPEVQPPLEEEDWHQVPVICPFYFDEVAP